MKGVLTGTKQSLLNQGNFTGASYPLPLPSFPYTRRRFPYGIRQEMEKLLICTKFRPIASCSVFDQRGPNTTAFQHLMLQLLTDTSAKPKWCSNWWKSHFQPRNCSYLLANLLTTQICEPQIFPLLSQKKNLIGKLKLQNWPVEDLNWGIDPSQNNHRALWPHWLNKKNCRKRDVHKEEEVNPHLPFRLWMPKDVASSNNSWEEWDQCPKEGNVIGFEERPEEKSIGFTGGRRGAGKMVGEVGRVGEWLGITRRMEGSRSKTGESKGLNIPPI